MVIALPLPFPASADLVFPPAGELRLARLALDLGAAGAGGTLSPDEVRWQALAITQFPASTRAIDAARRAIAEGNDPLGDELCLLRTPEERRGAGAFYTPPEIVRPMIEWALDRRPERLVDAGCGSGRFAAMAGRLQPGLALLAVDVDPLATLTTRAALAVLGLRNARVLHADYTMLSLPPLSGRTAFVGNPPYVRHHQLSAAAKARANLLGTSIGFPISGLAGLHAHFYLATAAYANPGDVGCFVTSSEWLDVGYGSTLRRLLMEQLGLSALHVLDPQAIPFKDAMATAAIACFEVGAQPQRIVFQLAGTLQSLGPLGRGRTLERETLTAAARWTPLLRNAPPVSSNEALVPLRSIARVHRGVVTGANSFFVLSRDRADDLGLTPWCRPAITSAEEVLCSDGVLRDAPGRRVLLDLPRDFDRRRHPRVDAYLKTGEVAAGGMSPLSARYVPSHRRPWWHLGNVPTPPIIVSYMARQAPVFALNPDRLAIVNIAHGLYPEVDLADEQLGALVQYLNRARHTFRGNGRTYHGGLEKFEPGELEALLVNCRR